MASVRAAHRLGLGLGLAPAAGVARRVLCRAAAGEGPAGDEREPPAPAGRGRGFGRSSADRVKPENAKDALIQSLDELSQSTGRKPEGTSMVMGEEDEAGWEEVDAKVNIYPIHRKFQAIGSGGEDFVQSITAAVSSVVGAIPAEDVKTRNSRNNNYISVNVGPVWVNSREDLQAVYKALKSDKRARWIL